jgi:WD40 repeat protein
VPRQQTQSSFFGVPNTLISISSQGVLGAHCWMPYDRSGATDFTFEIDPSLNGMAPGASNGTKRVLPGPFTPKSNKLFVVSPDAKHVIFGGLWDNSLRAYSIAKSKIVCMVVRHFEPITCLALDSSGSRHVMSGSRDTTSVIWEMSLPVGASSVITLRPIQVLCGHDKSVSCVALSVDLDLAVSGSEDGTVNVYTVKEGYYLRTIIPPDPGFYFTISHLGLSPQGQMVFSGNISCLF